MMLTQSGGAIRLDNRANLVLQHTLFERNWVDDKGGAVAIFDMCASPQACPRTYNLLVLSCTFRDNKAHDTAGAVYINDGGSATLPNVFRNCFFEDNSALRKGGALVVSEKHSRSVTHSELSFCTFRGNSAEQGGAVVSERNANLMLVSCLFEHNSAIKVQRHRGHPF